MKLKKSELLTIVLFCGFLASMSLMYLFLPKTAFSEAEKRYLAEAPELQWNAVASGAWGSEAETYMADHIPGRNFFVGLNAYFNLLTGRQIGEDIWLADSRLVEAPVAEDSQAVQSNMAAINSFSEAAAQPVDLMIIPSAGWAADLDEYKDPAIIESIYAAASDTVRPVDVSGIFAGKPELYFKTDHHWNSAGAHSAYTAYMDSISREAKNAESFEKEVAAKFQGSTYSRSALWLTDAEDLELWHSGSELMVTNGETDGTHEGVFYYERLEEADKYTVFLDGNHSLVRIKNANADGKLLVIRDSYSNCLGCFLAESYGEVVLVDLRYYKQPISQLAQQDVFDNILICYSIGNFMTDANFIWLR